MSDKNEPFCSPPSTRRAILYLVLPCPKCGRRYSPDSAEREAARCCGEDLPARPLLPTDRASGLDIFPVYLAPAAGPQPPEAS